tara:strand:- start:3129 stop:5561 length:2433 start_codon:yes stop_codon:yes gene_type:complete
MMDVNQRKMFRTRPARDKLNRMGGIMASSAPLMNTVAQYNQKRGAQNFQLGGGVQLPLLAEDQAKRALIEAVDQKFPQRNVFGRGITGGARPRGASLLQRAKLPLSLAARSALYGGPPTALALGAADLAFGEGVDREGIMANTPRAQAYLAGKGFTQKQFDALSPEEQQSLFQTEQDRRLALGTVAGSVGQEFAILPDIVQNLYEDVVGSNIVQRGLKAAGIINPISQFERTGRRDFEEGATRFKAENMPFDNISQFRASLPLDRETKAEIERQRQSTIGQSTSPVALGDPFGDELPAFDSADVTRADLREAATDIDKATATAATETGPEKEPIPAFDSADGTGTEEKRLTAEEAAAQEGDLLSTDAITKENNARSIESAFSSANQEIDSDPLGITSGTEIEALKKAVLDVLPKYDEDASKVRQGLLLTQMGAAIAAGGSGNAIKNIAEGVQKVLPAIISEKSDREKFKKELDVSAAKIALTEGFSRQREGRKKKNYFLGTDVDVTVNGRRITGKQGQLIRLNDVEFNQATQKLQIPLTTENVIVNDLKVKAATIKKQIEGEKKGSLAGIYRDKTTVYNQEGSYFSGVRFYEPTPEGAATGATNFFTENSINQVQASYETQKNELISSLGTVNQAIALASEATGVTGTFGRLQDKIIGLIGAENAKKYGLDPESLSGATQFDIKQRLLQAKFAPLLLGESGKTISDADRIRVAELLGITYQGQKFPGLFNNTKQVQESLSELKDILIRNNTALDSEYTALLQGSFVPGSEGNLRKIQISQPDRQKLDEVMSVTLTEDKLEEYLLRRNTAK